MQDQIQVEGQEWNKKLKVIKFFSAVEGERGVEVDRRSQIAQEPEEGEEGREDGGGMRKDEEGLVLLALLTL